jgi:hypothetical protein
MPEATMHEHRLLLLAEYQIWPSGKTSTSQAVAVTQSVRDAPDD